MDEERPAREQRQHLRRPLHRRGRGGEDVARGVRAAEAARLDGEAGEEPGFSEGAGVGPADSAPVSKRA